MPDRIHNSLTLSRFINFVMESGKKNTARKIVYGAFDEIKTIDKKLNPLEVFEEALQNVIGGMNSILVEPGYHVIPNISFSDVEASFFSTNKSKTIIWGMDSKTPMTHYNWFLTQFNISTIVWFI